MQSTVRACSQSVRHSSQVEISKCHSCPTLLPFCCRASTWLPACATWQNTSKAFSILRHKQSSSNVLEQLPQPSKGRKRSGKPTPAPKSRALPPCCRHNSNARLSCIARGSEKGLDVRSASSSCICTPETDMESEGEPLKGTALFSGV